MISAEVERIWHEFRKGCVDTQIKDRNPEDCDECLEGAVEAMAQVGLTNREAALMVLKASSFKVNDEDKYSILSIVDFTK